MTPLVGVDPSATASASRARRGVGPSPQSPIRTSLIAPSSTVTLTAAPARAKLWLGMAISWNDAPVSPSPVPAGTSRRVTISPSAREVS